MSSESGASPSAAASPAALYGACAALDVAEVHPFVFHVKLNRPQKLNALNSQMWEEIGSVFHALGDDPDCRAIVLSANGRLFTAGIDLSDLGKIAGVMQSEDDAARKARKLYNVIVHLQQLFTEIEKCPKPVIACVHNACVGGGVDLITATDIRFCTKDAWFQVKEVDLGLAADVGTLQRLPKVLGSQSLVRDLCFTARKMLSDEAERAGLVSRVFDDKEQMLSSAVAVAASIAEKSPVAVQGTKVNLNYARDHSVDEGLEFVARYNSVHLQADDMMQAGMAAITKSEEPPAFAKL